jgi:shikimate kinase/3-dehydroquinate synthase
MTAEISSKNIVITGFMGTGKSTVGQLVAARLGRRFVDTDDILTQRAGKPISAVFAEEGEAEFRRAETALCAELAQEQGLVLSTGGGALVSAENRDALGASGVLVCLTASADEVLRRLAAATDRPLLGDELAAREARVRTLLAQRRAAYAAIPYQIDTEGRSAEAVAALVELAAQAAAELPGMVRIPVRAPEQEYDICLGEGVLAAAGPLLARRGLRPGAVAIVTNAMIVEHAETLAASLAAAGFTPTICQIPEGEQHKTLATVASLYEQFLAAGLDRRGAVISVGGGVIGDMAGFAAASYLRGVPFVQVPTTLLAMVDASVGGKTGVDLPQGKNLVGAFKQPAAVLMDTAVFATLPGAEFRAGLAEVVKHGVIAAPRLFEQLEAEGPANLQQLVADAVRVKVDIVEEDPYEQGRRAVLNLGHTFGHALELVSEFTLRHGEAVAIGTVAASRMAAALGRCEPALAERIERLLVRLGLPTRAPGYDVDAVYAAMSHDKKRAGKHLRFIIPQALGDVVVIDDPGEAVVKAAISAVV